MLSLGSVPYANARPLIEGLAEEPAVRLLLEPPLLLARHLAAGDLDAALVPSVVVVEDPARVVVPVGCISSPGTVGSVSLFMVRPLRPGARLLLDSSSLTSATLVRILLDGPLAAPGCLFETCPPTTDPRTAGADGVLLIGDPALTLDRAGLEEIDLGEVWTRWTGLPFVWALWTARDPAAARAAEPVLGEARRRGEEALPAIVEREAARLGMERAAMEDYLGGRIRYDLGNAERAGLERFREECARAGLAGGPRAA